jgi:competence protein ComEA
MKRILTVVMIGAFVTVLAGSLYAQSAAPTPQPTPTQKPSTTKPATTEKKEVAKLDLNAATKEQLMALPGMTDPVADKILAGRPYKSKKDLVSKKIVTQAEYDKIHSHVVVKGASTTQKAKSK